ncbi:MmgE/PrpD family protein [Amycolatopsis jejuensis]|uniref:MmgE/PrpD family protein n=1 Tax=Amycolatopsis jejuensis TaxID=330084 RepID=UPI001B809F28|nr:MmgE/PrpD family protein [Amycolatopsis jejuensis]
MTTTTTERFVASLRDYRYPALQDQALHDGKRALFDCLGAMLAATADSWPILGLVEGVAKETGGVPESSLIGSSMRTNAVTAALLNGTLAYYCDIESHHPTANVHATAVVVPAALAVGQRMQCSGADLLAAVVGGIDAAARISFALGPAAQYARGFHPSTVAGTFGAAVAAGLLLGLDDETFLDALGLAGNSSSGLLAWVDDPSEQSRPLNIGLAARNGAQAALLAAAGLKGPADILAGKYPFGRAFSDSWDEAKLWPQDTSSLEVSQLFFKRWSCCVFIPASVEGVLAIRDEDQVPVDRIESITVRAPLSVYEVVDGNPLRSHNLQYVVAVAAHHGTVRFDDIINDRRLEDERVKELHDRITVKGDKSLDEAAGAGRQSVASTVTLTTRDGTRHSRHVTHPRGSAENPLTEEELRAKFQHLTEGVVSHEDADALHEAVFAIEQAPDLSELFARITK